MLGVSVLLDSAMEHYRGSFRNPAMVLPLLASSASVAWNGLGQLRNPVRNGSTLPRILHRTVAAIGFAGLGFHAWNILHRPDQSRWNNLFYGAPAGAPAALVLAGAFGEAGDRLDRSTSLVRATGWISAVGLLGTVGEAALLHFRGAFHNPAMWLPIAVPPVAAASLVRDLSRGAPHRATSALMATTASLGLAGAGLHAFGISRRMGGWRNWRQNLLAGPPLPAPPAFTGLAIAALGVLLLMREVSHE